MHPYPPKKKFFGSIVMVWRHLRRQPELIIRVGKNGNSEQKGEDSSEQLTEWPDHCALMLAGKVKTHSLKTEGCGTRILPCV